VIRVGVDSVDQPNHIETVIATLNGQVWKYSRYFDNPQFWSTPGTPVANPQCGLDPSPEDVVALQLPPTPCADGSYNLPYHVSVKHAPLPDQFEMYNVTDDPMELHNLYNDGIHPSQQNQLAQLLTQQRCAKRLVPSSGVVPGQPTTC
jgi:choline-sulfatase